MKDILATALIKACEDDDFKEELLVSPIITIEKLTGERLRFKEDFRISHFDGSKSENLDLTIPFCATLDDKELSQQELELVAGGATPDFKSQEDFITFLESYL